MAQFSGNVYVMQYLSFMIHSFWRMGFSSACTAGRPRKILQTCVWHAFGLQHANECTQNARTYVIMRSTGIISNRWRRRWWNAQTPSVRKRHRRSNVGNRMRAVWVSVCAQICVHAFSIYNMLLMQKPIITTPKGKVHIDTHTDTPIMLTCTCMFMFVHNAHTKNRFTVTLYCIISKWQYYTSRQCCMYAVTWAHANAQTELHNLHKPRNSIENLPFVHRSS